MRSLFSLFFFFNDTATTEIYTLSLHDALPISDRPPSMSPSRPMERPRTRTPTGWMTSPRKWCNCTSRSEEHTSELQSHSDLVCRLLLEKKKKQKIDRTTHSNTTESV